MNRQPGISDAFRSALLVFPWCCVLTLPVWLTGCALSPQLSGVTQGSRVSNLSRVGVPKSIPFRFRRMAGTHQKTRNETHPNNGVARASLADSSATSSSIATQDTRSSSPDSSRVPSGTHDAMQASYQQPMGRTYSNPSHGNVLPAEPLMPPHGFSPLHGHLGHPHMPYPGQPLGYGGLAESPEPMLAAPIPASPNSTSQRQRAHEMPPPHATHLMEEMESIDMNHSPSHIPRTEAANNPENRVVSSNQMSGENPIDWFDPSRPNQNLSHLNDGIRVSGSHLRTRPPTATERALQLKAENEVLRRELVAMKARVGGLSSDIERRDKALQQAERLTQEANRANALLRDSIATFKVRLNDAQKENQSIRQNADSTLEEIEATLDAVLVNTLSRNRNR